MMRSLSNAWASLTCLFACMHMHVYIQYIIVLHVWTSLFLCSFGNFLLFVFKINVFLFNILIENSFLQKIILICWINEKTDFVS